MASPSTAGPFRGDFCGLNSTPPPSTRSLFPITRGRTCHADLTFPSPGQVYPHFFPARLSQMLFNATLPGTMPGRRREQREGRRVELSTYFSVNPNLNDPIGTQVERKRSETETLVRHRARDRLEHRPRSGSWRATSEKRHMGTGDRHGDAAQAQGTHHSGIRPPLPDDTLWKGGKSGTCCCFQEMLKPSAQWSPSCTSPGLSITGGDGRHRFWGTWLSEDTRAKLCPDSRAPTGSGGFPV